MLHKVKKVEYLNGYKLKLKFNDQKIKIVDFSDWLNDGKGYLIPLKDIEYFKKVALDEFEYTIIWPNGADFCPDVLYEIGKDEDSS